VKLQLDFTSDIFIALPTPPLLSERLANAIFKLISLLNNFVILKSIRTVGELKFPSCHPQLAGDVHGTKRASPIYSRRSQAAKVFLSVDSTSDVSHPDQLTTCYEVRSVAGST